MDGGIDEWMGVCVYEIYVIYVRMHACMDRWMDGCMDLM